MIFSKRPFIRIYRIFVMIAAILFSVRCGSGSDDGTETPGSCTARFMDTGTASLQAKGYATDPRIELTGPSGTAYTLEIETGGGWCWTSRRTQAVTKSGTLTNGSEIIYLYLADNDTGAARQASIRVEFEGGAEVPLHIEQESYTIPASMDHAWAELPVFIENSNWQYVTHYAPLSATTTARNYTICYDRTKRIANWVAYPIHNCYMQGSYVRPDNSVAWQFDPEFPEEDQADLRKGSYRSGGVRGHQCMSNHRFVSYKSDASLAASDLNLQTFYSTNIMPQNSEFNGGSWLAMENIASSKRCADTLYIVTGTWGVSGMGSDRNGTEVAIPQYCWKVLLRTRSGNSGKRIADIEDASELMSIGFWAANSSESQTGLKEYITSVAEIEQKTGYTFFPTLDAAIAGEVKAQNNPTEWGIN